VAYNSQIRENKIKLLMEYESVTRNLYLATLSHIILWFFETKSVIKQQRCYSTQYGDNPPSDNVIRRWLKQFQEAGSVLHRKGAENCIPLVHLTCQERRAFGSCLAFCSTHSKGNKTVLFKLSYVESSFTSLFPV
jgi:hypothetical protein